MKWLIDRYTRLPLVRFAAACCILGTLFVAGLMFWVVDAPTASGFPHMGADYAGFYTAGVVQREDGATQLYDFEIQDRALRRSVAVMPGDAYLVYVHAPFLAPLFRPFARLPYAQSFALWLLLSASLYVGAVLLALRTYPEAASRHPLTAVLIALAFEPFIMEAWLGGQVSALGAAVIAAALACDRGGRRLLTGMSLSLLLYKPSLPPLILFGLIAGRQWRELAGFATGALVLAGLSIVVVGVDGVTDYVQVLLSYGRMGGASGDAFRGIKYVDVASALRLAGMAPASARAAGVVAAVILSILLWRLWWRASSEQERLLAWASTLSLLPIASPYAPVYDVTVAVPGIICGIAGLNMSAGTRWGWSSRAVLLTLFVSSWLSPLLAKLAGMQVITPALCLAGLHFLNSGLRAVAGSLQVNPVEGVDKSEAAR
jgi:hypothetical protein